MTKRVTKKRIRGRPRKRLAEAERKAAKKAGSAGLHYEPPAWAWRLLRAYLNPEVKPYVSHRCKEAGMSKNTFYEELKKPEFVLWFRTQLEEAVISDSQDVRQAHVRLCLAGDLDAIKLWYEQYGRPFPHGARPPAEEKPEGKSDVQELRDLLGQKTERVN